MNVIRLLLGTFVLLAAAGFVACGETTPVDFGGAIPDGAPHIDQDATKFKPTELTVDVLESVYFSNSSTALHNVVINGKNESGDMERGDVFSFTFSEVGEYQVSCTYHPQMKTKITVK